MSVGLSHKPACAGKGGRNLGMPRSPSMEAINAVSSPQTNAPGTFKYGQFERPAHPKQSLPQPATLLPVRQWLPAPLTASGYSCRM